MPEPKPLTVQPMDLASLDTLGADGLMVFAYSDEGPVGGLGDIIDWRLGSRINGAKSQGLFGALVGDQLLIPGPARLGGMRVFVFGLGPKACLDGAALTGCLAQALAAVHQAGCRRVAIALPTPAGDISAPELQELVLAQAAGQFGHIIGKVLDLRVD